MCKKERLNLSLDPITIRTSKKIAIDMRTTVSKLFTSMIQVVMEDPVSLTRELKKIHNCDNQLKKEELNENKNSGEK